ncbi:hypothetical protein MtrunA17_Chr4g0037371 [Medicago truncatula]|uniref:Transmembrane protein n=1 Tax=Medicago truncatula TaxID=3880 RepID=A0A396I9T7_MEDTR|nr:hypothetical protein MtrunA17_Chr4g0037371 [Medicago truncatula]
MRLFPYPLHDDTPLSFLSPPTNPIINHFLYPFIFLQSCYFFLLSRFALLLNFEVSA